MTTPTMDASIKISSTLLPVEAEYKSIAWSAKSSINPSIKKLRQSESA